MVENTLKQRARSFAEKHGVSYLTALRAVDEPLRALRDLAIRKGVTGYHPTDFRLTGKSGPLSAPYNYSEHVDPGTQFLSYRDFIDAQGLTQPNYESFTIELARRMKLIGESPANGIWSYRELYRAGLLPSGSPQLEPYFCYVGSRLPWFLEGLHSGAGYLMGVHIVSVAPALELNDFPSLIAVEKDRFHRLISGEDQSPVELAASYRESLEKQFKSYCHSVAVVKHPTYEKIAKFAIYFGREPRDSDFTNLGARREDFEVIAIDRSLGFLKEINRTYEMKEDQATQYSAQSSAYSRVTEDSSLFFVGNSIEVIKHRVFSESSKSWMELAP